jgi:hypothetical protein
MCIVDFDSPGLRDHSKLAMPHGGLHSTLKFVHFFVELISRPPHSRNNLGTGDWRLCLRVEKLLEMAEVFIEVPVRAVRQFQM